MHRRLAWAPAGTSGVEGGASPPPPGARRGRRRRGTGDLAAALAWIGPSYAVFLAIMAFPAVWNIGISFFSVSYGHNTFVGLANYRQILGSGQFY